MSKIKSLLVCAMLVITATFASSLSAQCPGGRCPGSAGLYYGGKTGYQGCNSGLYAEDPYFNGEHNRGQPSNQRYQPEYNNPNYSQQNYNQNYQQNRNYSQGNRQH